MEKNKNNKNQKIGFIKYSKENLKYLYKDIVLSSSFIFFSSTKPILSLRNGAWYVFIWYIISLLLLLELSCFNANYNIECKVKKKWHKRHGFNNKTKEEKNRIINNKKAKIELGGWTFLIIKLLVSIFFQLFLAAIAIKHQFNDYSNYMNSEKSLFLGIFMDTFVITVCTGYYSLIMDKVKAVKGFRNKILSLNMPDISDGHFLKNIAWNIISLFLLAYALIYSFNEFSVFMPIVMGGLYVIFLLIPIKDEICDN